MRSTHLIAAALLACILCWLAIPWLAIPPLARAAEPCVWKDAGKAPRLFLEGRVAVFRYPYDPAWAACAASSGDPVEAQWRVGGDAHPVPVKTDKLSLDRSGRDGPRRLESKVYPSQICDGRVGRASGKLVLSGLPGEERVSELVPIRVAVLATGPLAQLGYVSPPIDFPCPACDARSKGSLRVREGADGALTLESELGAAWFDCAKHGATLMLLGFGGQTQDDVTRAIRPDLALRDLERAFVQKGDKYVLRKPLPMARLCAGDAKVWSFELWGQGELMSASGGGRSIHSIRCR